jgi:hypothetical protein
MKFFQLTLLMLLFLSNVAQDDVPERYAADVVITLKGNQDQAFVDVMVSLKDLRTGRIFQGKTDENGSVKLNVPYQGDFEATFSNTFGTRRIKMPGKSGIVMKAMYQYDENQEDWSKKFPLSREKINSWNEIAQKLPDTIYSSLHRKPAKFEERFRMFELTLIDLYEEPLDWESVYVRGVNFNKVFIAKTNGLGKAYYLLPKGDTYIIEFKHHKNYSSMDVPMVVGISTHKSKIRYIGTKEFERREKEKEERMKREATLWAKKEKEFKRYLETEGIAAIKGRKDALEAYVDGRNSIKDKVISKVFDRNRHWKDKLIICDVTGSMLPYVGALATWYSINHSHDQNMQFVFFNDGDQKSDIQKEIGNTGGIYFTPSKGLDSMIHFMARVMVSGNGGDGPENDLEALIKGVGMANDYKELILIVDNQSTVKDIELLHEFDIPVRIILCGMQDEIEEDYLRIAFKTKGSVHTIEEDIAKLWMITDGNSVTIRGREYTLLNGRFYGVF